MDFWNFLFDSEYRQRADIESLKRMSIERKGARQRDRNRIKNQEERIQQLEDQVGELALLCRSLLTVLREDGTVAPERFEQVLSQIDAEDGVIDGKITPGKPPQDPPAAPEIQTW